MMNHEEAFSLLAPLALDALDTDVTRELEEHVRECPHCQSELDGHREVAAALGNTFEPLPEGLWEKISSQLYEREGSPTPPLVLADFVAPSHSPGRVATSRRGQSFSRRAKAAMGTVSLAAAAAIIALGINLAGANSQVAHLQNALNQSSESVVLSALATPGHKVVTLSNATSKDVAKFVMLPGGRGYLVSSNLPTLSSSETYQLWGIVNGAPVSVGVMGPSPRQVTFTLASSPTPSALAVTVEPAGGSLTPASSLVASGAV